MRAVYLRKARLDAKSPTPRKKPTPRKEAQGEEGPRRQTLDSAPSETVSDRRQKILAGGEGLHSGRGSIGHVGRGENTRWPP